MLTAMQSYELVMMMLCIWREARGESNDAKCAVAWVIKNRATRGGWFGKSIVEVILKPAQFSSFNIGDANATKFPIPATDTAYVDCLMAAKGCIEGSSADPTGGSTYYFDDSIAANPPSWAKAFIPTVKIGRLNFFKDK